MKSKGSNMTTKTSKKAVATGLTAGLLGGAAAGLIFGVPSLTSAASPAAIVQQTDVPDETPDGAAAEGERLRESLQELVDAGTIDAAQADAVTEHLVENRPDHGGRDGEGRHGEGRHGPGRLAMSETVSEILGLDNDELREQLRDGASLADIATANDVDPQTLVDALVAGAQERLDEAVANGRVDEADVAEKTADLEERVSDFVNGERPMRPGHDGEGG
jgi:hypothetical protein